MRLRHTLTPQHSGRPRAARSHSGRTNRSVVRRYFFVLYAAFSAGAKRAYCCGSCRQGLRKCGYRLLTVFWGPYPKRLVKRLVSAPLPTLRRSSNFFSPPAGKMRARQQNICSPVPDLDRPYLAASLAGPGRTWPHLAARPHGNGAPETKEPHTHIQQVFHVKQVYWRMAHLKLKNLTRMLNDLRPRLIRPDEIAFIPNFPTAAIE